MKKLACNPYLPSWEHIPDGEPYVYEGRVYIYGSHDLFNGWVFCLGDYVCWSAPIEDLGNWRYEGVIYKKTADPLNPEGKMCLYAPDMTVGPDGKYYLYYALDKVSLISVAVCDTPAGEFQFYGYVKHEDGSRLGDREGDSQQFDPGVLTEGEKTYLYTGFCANGDMSAKGSMCVTLGADMLTIIEETVYVVPSSSTSAGTGFEGHEFFEASSIRKVKDHYYFIYSSVVMHELCYAVSTNPRSGFTYGGVIVSNCDMHINTYKPADKKVYGIGNNHGSIVEINGQWFIFYHRQTNGTWFCRQGCAEPITILEDGTISQVEITSSGLNQGPLPGRGEYFGYLACQIFRNDNPNFGFENIPKITQDGRDGEEEPGFIAGITDGSIIGFKYFDCKDIKKITIKTRGYAQGSFEIKTAWDGPTLGSISIHYTNIWEENASNISIPDGVQALYFIYSGGGNTSLLSFTLE